ncbi:phytoene desaturase family protein [Litoribrevibacter euphylliae]|uniref:Phytoene desaturase family protein n=1 Tax=Litoribrevibacter euphylliae TaxID=1834034 RepID=A0ABV7HHM2_9GAMM
MEQTQSHSSDLKVSKIGQRYRPNRIKELQAKTPFDHIVIGSGIGGLSCAAALAKAGRRVLVLEQHYTAGGFTHSYEREGYEWDVGVHYVGQVGNPLTPPGMLFDWLSEGRLEWDSLGDVYDEFIIDGERYCPPIGRRAYKAFLKERFPDEESAINKYCQYLFGVERWVPLFFGSRSEFVPGFSKIGKLAGRLVPSYYLKGTAEVFDQLTDNATLKAVWSAQWGDLGLPPGQSSFLLHCLIASHYIYGGWYPRGGSSEIARTFLPTIEAAGGAVLTYAEVAEIVCESDNRRRSQSPRVTGVLMKDGTYIESASVISGCGWMNTQSLLNQSVRPVLHQGVNPESVKASACHVCLYVGFECAIDELGIMTGNTWVHHSTEYDQDLAAFEADTNAEFPFVYISSSAARDTSWSSRFPDRSVMEVVAVVPASEFEAWSGSNWGKRAETYEEKKEIWSQRLLTVLYQRYPQLKDKVSYYELSTPLSTQHFMKYPQGEIYGLAHTPQRYQQKGLKPKTAISGLFLTGQDAMTSGVVGAAMSGTLTAAEVLSEVYKNRVASFIKTPFKGPKRWFSESVLDRVFGA